MTTLEKLQRLERYIANDGMPSDSVIDLAMDKLLARETSRVAELRERLSRQLRQFEERYGLTSSQFHTRYERGEMGDEMDFVEWAATVEMLTNAEKELELLGGECES